MKTRRNHVIITFNFAPDFKLKQRKESCFGNKEDQEFLQNLRFAFS